MFRLIRFDNWWNIITPQILGWIYFCMLMRKEDLTSPDWLEMLFFMLGVICIASFGYLLNDYFDIKSDLISGKSNSLQRFNPNVRIVLVLLPLIMGIIFWGILKRGMVTNALYTLQVTSLILYSMPPFRLKEKGFAGVITDSFYGHVNPALFTISTFELPPDTNLWSKIVLVTLVLIGTTMKGIRNILLHQIDDRKKDLKAFIQTFTIKNGALFTLNIINNLIPLELLTTFCLVVNISLFVPSFFLSFLLFSFVTYLKFSGWKLAYLPQRQLRFKFLFFINDYYEGWMPVFFITILTIRNHPFSFLLISHLILFPTFVVKLWNDIKTIRQNFKTEESY